MDDKAAIDAGSPKTQKTQRPQKSQKTQKSQSSKAARTRFTPQAESSTGATEYAQLFSPRPGTRQTGTTKSADGTRSKARHSKNSVSQRRVSTDFDDTISYTKRTKTLYSALAVLSGLVLIITGVMWEGRNELENSIEKLRLQLGGVDDGATDILLVGLDSRTDAHGNPLSQAQLRKLHADGSNPSTNTDTIILVRVPYNGTTATAISLPRDAYVNIPGIGKAKLNSAYGSTYEETLEDLVDKQGKDRTQSIKVARNKGRQALIETVSQLTGVTVDHYAEIGLADFAQFTDAVHGVEVCLKHRVYDPYSGANFRAGKQLLNGAQALSFVRQRHGLPRGDIDRIVRQQVYMASLAHKILSSGTLTNPGKIQALLDTVKNSIAIDDGWDIADFANRLTGMAAGKITFATIPIDNTAGWSDDGQQSVVIVNPDKVKQWVGSLVGSSSASANSKPAIDVFNAGSTEGLATNVSTTLQTFGYPAGTVENRSNDSLTDSVVLTKDNNQAAQEVAKKLGLTVKVDSSVPSGAVQVYLTDTYSGPGTPYATSDSPSTSNSPSPASHAAPTSQAPSPNAVPPHAISANDNNPRCVD